MINMRNIKIAKKLEIQYYLHNAKKKKNKN